MPEKIQRNAPIPSLDDLPAPPRTIVLHWTAGDHLPTDHELQSYHYLVSHAHADTPDPADDLVAVEPGVAVRENMGDVSGHEVVGDPDVDYAAHTLGYNSYSVGVALCGMRGATDYRPDGSVDPGTSPITRKQVRCVLGFVWSLCQSWGLDPEEPENLTTHYEMEWMHGVDQYPRGPGSWRWDVTWIPGLDLPKNEYGFWVREQVASFEGGSEIGVDW